MVTPFDLPVLKPVVEHSLEHLAQRTQQGNGPVVAGVVLGQAVALPDQMHTAVIPVLWLTSVSPGAPQVEGSSQLDIGGSSEQ